MKAPWFYVSDRRERLRFDEAEVPAMVEARLLRPETMVWQPGWGGWVSASEVRPEWFGGGAPPPPAPTAAAAVQSFAAVLGRYRGWFVFVSALLFVVAGAVLVFLASALATGRDAWMIAGLAALPGAVFGGLAGVGLARCAAGFASSADLGQQSPFAAELDRLGRAVRLIGTGLALTLGLGVLAGVLVAVLY
jgi:hypothetical protein